MACMGEVHQNSMPHAHWPLHTNNSLKQQSRRFRFSTQCKNEHIIHAKNFSRNVHIVYMYPTTRFFGVCRDYADFLYLLPILRQFRIIRCNRQAALHSALFNYTPLVLEGTDKNKQLTIIKPMQTGINRNKQTFCIMKSSEPLKKFKNQPHPLVKPSSVNFCQHF
jgi:hypothetical protein